MSAPALPLDQPATLPAKPAVDTFSPLDIVEGAMRGVASLKLTVVLFALGIFVVLVGTLAQTQADIWQVVRDYFHAWVMWVDVNLFFPQSFFPGLRVINLPAPDAIVTLSGGWITNFHTFPAPGGKTVGVLMALNLLAAHGWRFKIQSEGARLWGGLAVIAAGVVLTVLVILSGHNEQGFQAKPPFTYPQLWGGLQALSLLGLVAGGVALFHHGIRPTLELPQVTWMRILTLGGIALVIALIAGVLVLSFMNSWYPGDEALRVLWQMVQGGLAGIVMMVGCVMVFRKRGGIVLLHAGIGLLMVNELLVARQAVEWQMFLAEGQSSNYLKDIRTVELAIIDRSGEKTDEHIVVPRHLLEKNASSNAYQAKYGKPPVSIQNKALPFDVAVLTYYRNADVRPLKPGETTPATKQRGQKEVLVELPAAKGTDMGGGVDFAGAYVKLTAKDGSDLGTYLLSQLASEQTNPDRFAELVTVGGTQYQLFLRFKRDYRPFTVSLVDVRKDDYVASDTPRNYSSDIRLVDAQTAVDQTIHIKMNDPLRYRGETYYQSGYHKLPQGEATTLQVVKNRIWMIPYVACMIVAIGLAGQFLTTASRFVSRRESEELAGGIIRAELAEGGEPIGPRSHKRPQPTKQAAGFNWSYVGLPALVAGLFVMWVGSTLRQPATNPAEMDLARFGRLPVAHMGRIKPLDTLARNSLMGISNRDYVMTPDGKKVPAIKWLLEVITGSEKSLQHRLVRIEHPELLKLFKLEPRVLNYRYSIEELLPEIDNFLRQAEVASKLRPEERSIDQRKLLELKDRLEEHQMLVHSFGEPRLPPFPTVQDFETNLELAKQKLRDFQIADFQQSEELKRMKAPRLVPLDMPEGTPAEEHWQHYPTAVTISFKNQFLGKEPDPFTPAFRNILIAYTKGDAAEFNKQVGIYEAQLRKADPPLLNTEKVHFEQDFNRAAPFRVGMYAYFLAFLLAIFGWLTRWQPLNWTAFTLIVLTLLLHTAALIARIYISGRPPVTNLYSSAVFIGWGAVIFGVNVEAIYRVGLGNIIASVAGYATLLISVLLALDGDTIAVMQAVLDTQFWLATHVVCITLGYSATFVAGLLGLLYLVLGMSTPHLDGTTRKDIGRMIYGVVCFALLFSFVGTVLGGLWADDSWGRFWGWDPKENGALLIVLWNALVLHARWDKMIADRGLALLAIGGNIVTAWSWFGVNELGIGLHSYGFTEGVVAALFTFFLYMAVCIGFGSLLPVRYWWSQLKPGVDSTASVALGMSFLFVHLAFVSTLGVLACMAIL